MLQLKQKGLIEKLKEKQKSPMLRIDERIIKIIQNKKRIFFLFTFYYITIVLFYF